MIFSSVLVYRKSWYVAGGELVMHAAACAGMRFASLSRLTKPVCANKARGRALHNPKSIHRLPKKRVISDRGLDHYGMLASLRVYATVRQPLSTIHAA